MSKGFINVSVRQNGNIGYYLREKECSYFLSSKNLSNEKEELKNQWLEIENLEKLGNKDLGIRGRHDARVCKSYILSMPNELTPEECATRVKNIIDKTPIKDCSYTICVHQGEKEGITNQHVHLLVNERNLETLKKDREMIKKSFLGDFKEIYQNEFEKEFNQGKETVARGRVETGLFWANQSLAREMIAEQQKSLVIENNAQILELQRVWYMEQVQFALEIGLINQKEKQLQKETKKQYGFGI
jgi:hypothetical protein